MPQRLDFEEYGDAIGMAWMAMRDNVMRTGPTDPVPTCPGWTVRDLVAHQGMVHRWATGIITGQQVDSDAVVAEGLAEADQLDWFDVGARALLQALADAPDDLEAFFFLHDAAPAKFAWARRQAHEITIHAVDAMAAARRGVPGVGETWLRPDFAIDGIDELVMGFMPRSKSRLRSDRPLTVLIEATDVDEAWTLQLSGEPPTASVGPPATWDARLYGDAVALYLGLWNRGDVAVDGDEDVLALWRASGF